MHKIIDFLGKEGDFKALKQSTIGRLESRNIIYSQSALAVCSVKTKKMTQFSGFSISYYENVSLNTGFFQLMSLAKCHAAGS